ncbi:MerR family transcriptional regulator [Streptomyces sodiiphilus]|uniref:MerR family transcriptional regulator n=1 Tax=Streptomyces sodiiphilus TaxID=226217 RepID=A0ABN2PT35_9ACTN
MCHSVGRVAALAGVTVRTLHHYDAIGLLRPGGRSPAGHRRYTDADLDRLQQILSYRELGFPLEEIAVLLDDPEADPVEHLRRQHELLTARIGRLREMADAVEYAMEARKMGIRLTPEERFEVFGDAHDWQEYDREAERRWGTTEAWEQSRRRAAALGKEDWRRIKEESDGLHRRLAGLLAAGEAPDGEAAMELAEEQRRQISRYFYDCTYDIHTGLARMYIEDQRFTATYEEIHPGLARYLHDAILANAARRR